MDINAMLNKPVETQEETVSTQPAPTAGQSDLFAGLGDALKSATSTGNSNLPAGKYVVRMEGGEFRMTKTGSPMFTVTYKVIDGDKFVNKLEFVPFFLKKKDGSWNTGALGDFKKLVKVIVAGSTEEQADQLFMQSFKAFIESGQDKFRVAGFEGHTGTLTVTVNETNGATFTNYSFNV